MICQTCSIEAKYMQFQTFSYHYCETCKKEVEEKAIDNLANHIGFDEDIIFVGSICCDKATLTTQQPNAAIFNIDLSDDLD